MSHHDVKSPPPRTYTARAPLGAQTLTCRRCGRIYPYPAPGGPPIRCECGWRYKNVDGLIEEDFAPRLGV